MAKFTQFDLPTDAYASFDAQSLRDLIISRINNSFNWYRCHQELNNGLEGDQISIDMPLQPRNILKRMFNEINGNISGVIKIKPE